MIFILIHSFTGICGYDRILWFIDHFRMRSIPFEFKRQCVNDACNYLLNKTFPFGLSCFSNQIMNSIGVFSGDRIKDTGQEKIVCISLLLKFIHLIQDFVLCIQCFITLPKFGRHFKIFNNMAAKPEIN